MRQQFGLLTCLLAGVLAGWICATSWYSSGDRAFAGAIVESGDACIDPAGRIAVRNLTYDHSSKRLIAWCLEHPMPEQAHTPGW